MNWHDIYSEDTMAILDAVRKFLHREASPLYKTHEKEGKFPSGLIPKMAEMGLFGLTIPEEYGGSGLGTLEASLVAREIAYCWGALHLIWSANVSLSAFPIMHAGSDEQKRHYLPRLASGEILGCFALTEPNSGSDAAGMSTKARKEGNHWILNGSKTFITNASHARLAIIFAKTGGGRCDISAFIVTSGMPGLSTPGITVRKIPKRVQKSSDFCEITFNNVELPANALLGKLNQGFNIAMATLDNGRINIAAQAVGIAARVFDDAFEYVSKVRSQFDRMVWNNQAVQFNFADAFARLLAAWAMIERTSKLADEGHPITQIASATKLFATEESRKVAQELADYFGGMLITEELDVASRLLDLIPTTIYEGTSNVQRMVIARELQKQNA